MILKSQLSIEAHSRAASVYVHGPLSAATAGRISLGCRTLPHDVRAVRVDLRAVTVSDADALTMLEALLIEWSADRRGQSRIAYPRHGGRDAFVAIPCAIRDASDAPLQRERDDRVVSSTPYPVW